MVRTLNEHPTGEAHTQSERQYWSSLLSGRMMPGLGLAASRYRATEPVAKPLPKVTGRLVLPAEDPTAITPSR